MSTRSPESHSGLLRPTRSAPTSSPYDREPDTVALQLDLATEAALAAIPTDRGTTRSAAGRALEASIERYLSDGGLADLARNYRACRRRRAVASATAVHATRQAL